MFRGAIIKRTSEPRLPRGTNSLFIPNQVPGKLKRSRNLVDR